MRGVICVLLTIFCVSGAQRKTCRLPSSSLTRYASEDWHDLNSPNYGVSNYADNTLCEWTIRSQDPSKRIVLVVGSLDLETSGSSGCYDYIQISDDYNFTEKYCRPGVMPITIRRQTLYVRFSTDSVNTHLGFHLCYRLISATENTESSVFTQICRSGGLHLQAESSPKNITSLNYPLPYPPGINGYWTIAALTANHVVKIIVEDSGLQPSSSCSYEYLIAFDAPGAWGTQLGRWCGSTKPTIYSTGSSLTLTFHSDGSGSGRGFKLSYQEVPGNESSVFTQMCRSEGVKLQAESYPKEIASLNYPWNYPDYANCEWTIQTLTANHVVKIVVEDSDLDVSPSCYNDYLDANDASGTLGAQLNRWCGTTKPTIYSSGSYLTLKFHSDGSINRRGFKLSYQEVPEADRPVTIQTCHFGGMNLQAESSPTYISSLNYPQNYPPYADCQWIIQTLTANYVVKIVVDDLDLEDSSSCSYDYLAAYDAWGTQLEKWCGTTKPTIYSPGSSLTLKFHSDGSSNGRGFKLSYQEVPGTNSSIPVPTCRSGGMNLQAQSTSKYITSPNYPEYYPHDTFCQWTIRTLKANYVVKIVVEDSDLESSSYCSLDYLIAYDDSGAWGTQLGKWCGTTKPTIYSSGSSLTLKFHSEGSGSGRGFKLSYQEVPESERVPERVSGLSTGAIIGIIVGVVAGLILLSICICCCCCAQRNKPTATAGTAAAVASRGMGGSQVFFTSSTFRPNSGQMTTNQHAAAYDLPPYPGPAQCSSLLAFAAPMGISYPQSNAPAGYPAQVPTSTAGSADYNRQESLPSEPSPPYWMADQYEVQPAQQPTLDTSGAGGQSQPSSAAAASSTATVPAPGADTQPRAQGSAPPAAPRSGQAAPGGSDNRAFVPDEV